MRRYWVIARGADLLYLSRVHCSKGKTSNASLQTHCEHTLHPTTGVHRRWGQTHKPQRHPMQMVGLSLPSEIRHFLQPRDVANIIFRSLKHLQKPGPSSSLVPDLSAVANKLTPTCATRSKGWDHPLVCLIVWSITQGGQPSASNFRDIQFKPVPYCQKAPLIPNTNNTQIIMTFQLSPSSSRYHQ